MDDVDGAAPHRVDPRNLGPLRTKTVLTKHGRLTDLKMLRISQLDPGERAPLRTKAVLRTGSNGSRSWQRFLAPSPCTLHTTPCNLNRVDLLNLGALRTKVESTKTRTAD